MRFMSRGVVAEPLGEPMAQRRDVGLLHRPEAAVAGAVEAGTQGAAAGLGDRAQARLALGHQHAGQPAPLALDAHAVGGDVRLAGPPAAAESNSSNWSSVDRAAAQLEVDEHVRGDRRRRVQRRDVLRLGVDAAGELLDVGPVAQCLDAARGRAGADRDRASCSRGGSAGSAPLPRAWRCFPRPGRCRRAEAIRGAGPPGNRRSRPRRPGPAARLPGSGPATGSRRNWRTCRPPTSACRWCGCRGMLASGSHVTSPPWRRCRRCRQKQNTGPSVQTNLAPYWQWPQRREAAVHVPLQADVDLVGRDVELQEIPGGHAVEDLRPAHQHDRCAWR